MSEKTKQCKDCRKRRKDGFCEAIGKHVPRRRTVVGCEHFRSKKKR